jgi:PAS domain S-box-containing protein
VAVIGKASLYAYTIEETWRVIQWLLPEPPSQHGQNVNNSPKEQTHSILTKCDSSTLDRKLELAPADRVDATTKLSWHGQDEQRTESNRTDPLWAKGDPFTLGRKLEDALADRDDVSGKLTNLRQMIEMVDVGMFEYNIEGVLLYANDAFHNLAGVPKGNQTPMEWANWVFEEDKSWLTDMWNGLAAGGSFTFEMRWIGPNFRENPEGQWVTAACVPTTDGAGNVISISGCITDISAQKRSHSDAVKKAEALERAQASEMRFSSFVKHSNSAFYNFGIDQKVRAECTSKVRTKACCEC